PAAPAKGGGVTVGGGQPAGGPAAPAGGTDDSSAVDRMMLASPAASGEAAATEPGADAAEGTAVTAVVDAEAESLALARQLMEEEAMASYAMAVDNFRSAAAAARAAGG
ncbi:unnamed protein product, partial [Ectocarpus fasciculatus]